MERRFRHWMVRACHGPSALYRADEDAAVVEQYRPDGDGWAVVDGLPERVAEVRDPLAVRDLQQYLVMHLGPWSVSERDPV